MPLKEEGTLFQAQREERPVIPSVLVCQDCVASSADTVAEGAVDHQEGGVHDVAQAEDRVFQGRALVEVVDPVLQVFDVRLGPLEALGGAENPRVVPEGGADELSVLDDQRRVRGLEDGGFLPEGDLVEGEVVV